MRKALSLIKSSFHDIRCCDETTTNVVVTDPQTGETVTLGWRALASSITCVVDGSGTRTGFAHVATLEKYDVATNAATGDTKPNSSSDSSYIADYPDNVNCSVAITNNFVKLYSNSGAITSIHLTKGADHFDLANDLPYSEKAILPGSYTVDIVVYQDDENPRDLSLSVNGSQPELVSPGNGVQYLNLSTPIRVDVVKLS